MVEPAEGRPAPRVPPKESNSGLAEIGKRAGTAMLWQAGLHGSEKAVNLARLLILAAILTPDDFGLLAVSLIAVSLFAGLTEIGLTPALVQRQSIDQVHYDTAWTFGLLRGVVVALVVAGTAPWIAEFLKEPRAVDIIRVLGFSPLLQALASIRVADLMRKLQFRSLTLLRLAGTLISALTAILLAPWLGVWALVAGTLAGPLVFSSLSYIIAPYRPGLRLDWTALCALIKFGQWIFLTGLIAIAGTTILQSVISRELGTLELGLYFLAVKLTFTLTEVGQQVISNVAFPLYARLQGSREEVGHVFRSLLIAMCILLLPPFAILIALAPAIPEILGAKWAGAAPLIQLLSLAAIIGLLGDTAVPLLQGLGRPSRVSVLEALQSGFMILAALLLTGPFGLFGAASSWVVACSASFVMSVIFVTRMLERPFHGISALLLAIGSATLCGGLVAALMHGLMPSGLGAIVAGAVSLALVWGSLWLIDSRYRLGLRRCAAVMFPALAPKGGDRDSRSR